jgi:hypothetical protein
MVAGQDEPLSLLSGYETHIYGAGREPAFLMLAAFVLTLAGTRFYTRMARTRGWGSARVGGVHVHHLVPGVVMTLVTGGLAVGLEPRELWVASLATVFGAGAALVLDEFAMLLHLDDVYWTTEGIWARRLYPEDGRRRRRSEARFAAREARWAHRRDRFYDLIGGAPHVGSKRDPAPKTNTPE